MFPEDKSGHFPFFVSKTRGGTCKVSTLGEPSCSLQRGLCNEDGPSLVLLSVDLKMITADTNMSFECKLYGIKSYTSVWKKRSTTVNGFYLLSLCFSLIISHYCILFSGLFSFPFFSLADFKNAFGFEVCLSIREHLEACGFISAQGAVYRTACGTSACLIWEVWYYVARAGQCLRRLSFYQKVQIYTMLKLHNLESLSTKLIVMMVFRLQHTSR